MFETEVYKKLLSIHQGIPPLLIFQENNLCTNLESWMH